MFVLFRLQFTFYFRRTLSFSSLFKTNLLSSLCPQHGSGTTHNPKIKNHMLYWWSRLGALRRTLSGPCVDSMFSLSVSWQSRLFACNVDFSSQLVCLLFPFPLLRKPVSSMNARAISRSTTYGSTSCFQRLWRIPLHVCILFSTSPLLKVFNVVFQIFSSKYQQQIKNWFIYLCVCVHEDISIGELSKNEVAGLKDWGLQTFDRY